VGKTRLALQVAEQLSEQFAAGVFFVNLASTHDAAFVVPSIAQALDIKESGERRMFDLLKSSLHKKQLLLLLDNFEQVVEAASQIAELLATCPEIKVLVTSRMALHIQAEHEFTVPPLTLPDPRQPPTSETLAQYEAVALFIERARAVKSDFQVTHASIPTIAAICVRLDGLPLTIELAAARIKLLPPRALLARLNQRLPILTSGAQDAPVRQQTLRNTIEWSYHLLQADEQRLFRQLSTFVGGCTLQAAEAICTPLDDGTATKAVLDGVASLIDKNLLQQTEHDGEEPRLVMLETIREYGLEALAASGEIEAMRQAYAEYYLAFAEEGEPKLISAEQAMWLERLEREHDNLRAALAWLAERKECEAALKLGSALWRFWWRCGYYSEGRAELARSLAADERGVATSVRAKALHAAGSLANVQADFEQAEAFGEESLALFRALGDPHGSATSLTTLGHAAWQRSNYVAARSLLEEAVALCREVGDRDGITLALVNLATVFLLQGEYDQVRTLVEEAVELSRERGDTWDLANALRILALAMSSQGDLIQAHALLEESLALSRREGYKGALASSLFASAQMVLLQGDVASARWLLDESLALFKALGDRQNVAQSLFGLGWISFIQGDYATASALLEESLALFKAGGSKWFIALCLTGFGALATA
jgi:predicted ATPase